MRGGFAACATAVKRSVAVHAGGRSVFISVKLR
jgi:hypothetical protein